MDFDLDLDLEATVSDASDDRRPAMRTLRAVGRHLVNIACVVILLISAALLVPGFFGYERYVITGGSMSGSFEPGAVVFTRAIPVVDLQVGDVITYQPPPDSGVEGLVTHRIAEIEDDPEQGLLFTTKGDANDAEDPWRFRIDDATQPRVELAVDHLGWPLIWIADPATRAILIGLPAAIIFLLAARELITAVRRPKTGTVER